MSPSWSNKNILCSKWALNLPECRSLDDILLNMILILLKSRVNMNTLMTNMIREGKTVLQWTVMMGAIEDSSVRERNLSMRISSTERMIEEHIGKGKGKCIKVRILKIEVWIEKMTTKKWREVQDRRKVGQREQKEEDPLNLIHVESTTQEMHI
jgi:hypothetical protein